eukprot:COSAG01_NODE_21293_length_909_cov_0.864198_1_plen_220_part_00
MCATAGAGRLWWAPPPVDLQSTRRGSSPDGRGARHSLPRPLLRRRALQSPATHSAVDTHRASITPISRASCTPSRPARRPSCAWIGSRDGICVCVYAAAHHCRRLLIMLGTRCMDADRVYMLEWEAGLTAVTWSRVHQTSGAPPYPSFHPTPVSAHSTTLLPGGAVKGKAGAGAAAAALAPRVLVLGGLVDPHPSQRDPLRASVLDVVWRPLRPLRRPF